MKQNIVLREQDLHMLVEGIVRNVLAENGMEEGALWNAFKQKGQQIGQNVVNKAQQIGQGAMNMGNNMRNTYQAGRQDAQLRKYAQNAVNALIQLQTVAQKFNPNFARVANMCIGSINKVLTQSSQNLQNISQNTFSTNNSNQQM